MLYPGLNTKDMSDDQLQKSLTDVSIKLSKPGIRADIASQLRSILDALKIELQERMFKKTVERDSNWKSGVVLDTQEDKKDKDDFDKLININ